MQTPIDAVDYVSGSYTHLNDSRLRFPARGILGWMMLQPAGYRASVGKLRAESGDPDKVIRDACKTLSCYGYATFHKGVLQLRQGAEPWGDPNRDRRTE